MACKLACLFDWLVKHEQPYVDKEHYETKYREQQIRSVKKGMKDGSSSRRPRESAMQVVWKFGIEGFPQFRDCMDDRER